MASKIPPEPRDQLPTDDASANLVYGVVVLLPIVTAVVCLRIYTRRFVVRWMGVDDWMILGCWVGTFLWPAAENSDEMQRCRARHPKLIIHSVIIGTMRSQRRLSVPVGTGRHGSAYVDVDFGADKRDL